MSIGPIWEPEDVLWKHDHYLVIPYSNEHGEDGAWEAATEIVDSANYEDGRAKLTLLEFEVRVLEWEQELAVSLNLGRDWASL